MFDRLPEPYELYDSYCDKLAKEEEKLPVCEMCGNRIYDDYLIDLDGDLYHEDCFLRDCRKPTENYID